MEKKRIIKLSYKILIVFTIVILIVCFFNLIFFLSTVISGDSFGLDLNKNEITGEWILSFDANPSNSGILPVSLYLEVTLYDLDNNIVANNSSLVSIGVGSSESLSFSLVIPPELVQGEDIKGDEGNMQMIMRVRTFADLVGFTQSLRVGGNNE